MSDETLGEARKEYARRVRLGGPISIGVVDALVAAERADAERVQRERAELAEKRCRDHHLEACESCAVTESDLIAQRERADGLERDAMAEWQKAHPDLVWVQRGEIAEEVEQATRPYRMAIAKYLVTRQMCGAYEVIQAREELRKTITDSDIEAARAALRAKEDR